MADESSSPSSSASPEQAAATTGGQGAASEFERWYDQQPLADPGVAANGAKVLIVKFNDYQCPACGQSHRDYKPILAKYAASHPGAVRLVAMYYPLEPECNFNVPSGAHHAACEAAAAVRMADGTGRRDAMEDWLYANQGTLTTASVRQAAQAIGGISDFDAQYPAMLQAIRGDVAAGGALGVRSTPTFYINGRMIRGALPAQYFDEAIALELKRAAAK
jgi:protein-disulfide isomerase